MRKFIVRITKILRVYHLLKRLNLIIQSKFGMGHGHNLFLFLINKKNKKNKKNFKYFLEIGSTREAIYGQGSTEIIAKYCEEKKINFISVDADSRNTNRLRKKLNEYKYFDSINDKGENFANNTNLKFDCIYLDAFDIEKLTKNNFREKFYMKKYKSNITNEMSENIHLEIVKNLRNKINDHSIIVFDDTFKKNNLFIGKGGKAIPYLIKIGFKVIASNSNSVALER